MTRTHRATRSIAASPERVFAAMTSAEAMAQWLPPTGMSGRFEWFDARPGGGYGLVLTHDAASATAGKSTADADVVAVRFVELVPGRRLVQAVDFDTDDPAFSGTMTVTWQLHRGGDATQVEITAHDVPPGISAEDHAVGMNASLDNLAHFLGAAGAAGGTPGAEAAD
ncbi:MAG: SRPBCC domain-containing protein [Marmoricola sp.]